MFDATEVDAKLPKNRKIRRSPPPLKSPSLSVPPNLTRKESKMIEYSLVVPVFNEEESLRLLYDEIVAVAETLSAKIELIFVDDGSTDKSWSIIEELAEKDERVRGIRFRRNFGKAAALDVGFKAATLPIVMTLDADLQDDPKEIPNSFNSNNYNSRNYISIKNYKIR